MNNTTSRRGRYAVRAAAVATTAAVIFGAAACGSETASDNGQDPAAPAAPAPKAHATPRPPVSADAAERQARAEQLEQYRRHLLGPSPQAEPSVTVHRQPHGYPAR
jgi:hypothetical protein